jgi:hypothetical protein
LRAEKHLTAEIAERGSPLRGEQSIVIKIFDVGPNSLNESVRLSD